MSKPELYTKPGSSESAVAPIRLIRAHIQLDSFGRIVTWPEEARQICDIHPDAVLGHSLSGFLDSKDMSAIESFIAGQPSKSSTLNLRSEWHGRLFELSIASLLDRFGELLGFSMWLHGETSDAYSDDLPATMKSHNVARLAMRDQTSSRSGVECYCDLIDSAADLIVILDADGKIFAANQQACNALGYSRGELVGQFPKLFAQRLTANSLNEFRPGLAHGRSFGFETVYRKKNGDEFPVEIKLNSVLQHGQLYSMSIARDISESQDKQRRLVENEQRLRLAIDNVRLGTWRYIKGQAIVTLDETSQSLAGFNTTDVAITDLLRRVHPEDRAAVIHAIRETLFADSKQDQIGLEHRFLLPDGTVRWVSVRAYKHFERADGVGQPIRIEGTSLDITQPKVAVLSLRGQNRIFEAIAIGSPLDQTLDTIVGLIETQISGAICSILLLSEQGTHLNFKSGKRVPEELQRVCEALEIGPDVGACGSAAWHRKPVFIDDVRLDSRFDAFLTLMNQSGLRCCWSVPIFGTNKGNGSSTVPVLGTFAIYKSSTGLPDQAALQALETGSHLASVAITTSRTLQDITEAEARLSLISRITQSVTFAITITTDGRCHFDWARPHFGLLSGYTYEEINTVGWRNLVDPQDYALIEQMYRDVVKGDVVRGEFRYRTKFGKVLYVQSHIKLLRRDQKTGANTILGGIWDITELKAVENALRRSESFLRKAQGIASLGRWELNLARRVVEICEETKERYALDSRTFTLQEFRRLVHPQDRRSVREILVRLNPGNAFDMEFRLIVGGATHWIVLKAAEEYSTENDSRKIWGTLQDITERRQLENQYRQSQKLEAFGQLAGGVAHDFNNLLTVINGTADMLLSSLNSDQSAYSGVTEIREAGERAATLTRQLLVLSRQQFTEPSIVDVNAVVARAGSMLRRVIGEHIQVQTSLENPLPAVKLGQGHLDQVLLNLAVNARDAMDHGGVLFIKTSHYRHNELPPEARNATGSAFVCLSVSDTGCGMSDEVKARLFEPFYSTKGVGKGTGLGLATVYGIIQQNHGKILVTSSEGNGTRFDLYFPAIESALKRPSDERPKETVQRGLGTVLLVEDEPMVRQLTSRVLTNYGYHVLEAESGDAAMQVADKHGTELHLLLTDVVMPGMSGTELSQKLRGRYPSIGVLFMSGYADDDFLRRGVSADLDAFIQKPFTPSSLVKRVQALIENAASRSGS